ncbi:MAG: hypothetical protein O7C56_04920 [Rickettsia endosymbiont of Ixodes persulcatus]|nr:hypothetical protein [Rickettsia endosymbiont of Ixodes persulcatus]
MNIKLNLKVRLLKKNLIMSAKTVNINVIVAGQTVWKIKIPKKDHLLQDDYDGEIGMLEDLYDNKLRFIIIQSADNPELPPNCKSDILEIKVEGELCPLLRLPGLGFILNQPEQDRSNLLKYRKCTILVEDTAPVRLDLSSLVMCVMYFHGIIQIRLSLPEVSTKCFWVEGYTLTCQYMVGSSNLFTRYSIDGTDKLIRDNKNINHTIRFMINPYLLSIL